MRQEERSGQEGLGSAPRVRGQEEQAGTAPCTIPTAMARSWWLQGTGRGPRVQPSEREQLSNVSRSMKSRSSRSAGWARSLPAPHVPRAGGQSEETHPAGTCPAGEHPALWVPPSAGIALVPQQSTPCPWVRAPAGCVRGSRSPQLLLPRGPPALAHHRARLWAKWAARWLPLFACHPRGSQARGHPAGGRMAALCCVAEQRGWSISRPRCCPPRATAAAPVMYSSQGAPVQLQYHYWRLLHH